MFEFFVSTIQINRYRAIPLKDFEHKEEPFSSVLPVIFSNIHSNYS